MSITDTTPVLSDLTINLVFDSVSSTYPDRTGLQICKKIDNGNLLIDINDDCKVHHVSIPKPPTPYGNCTQNIWVPINAPLEAGEQALLEQFVNVNMTKQLIRIYIWSPNQYELNMLLTRENPLDEWILTQILPRDEIASIKQMFDEITGA